MSGLWTEHVTADATSTFYYNAALNQSTWEKPASYVPLSARQQHHFNQYQKHYEQLTQYDQQLRDWHGGQQPGQHNNSNSSASSQSDTGDAQATRTAGQSNKAEPRKPSVQKKVPSAMAAQLQRMRAKKASAKKTSTTSDADAPTTAGASYLQEVARFKEEGKEGGGASKAWCVR